MVLVLDLGNTNLFVGVYQKDVLLQTYRMYSDKTKSSDAYKESIRQCLASCKLKASSFEGAILSSVIPSLTKPVAEAVASVIGKPCLVVGPKIKTGLSIRIDQPTELGADLVCDAVGALESFPHSLLVVDFGTATKFSVIDQKSNFVGCVILPGIKLAYEALSAQAAQLMDISYEPPKKIVGKNSMDSLNAGAIYGTIAQLIELANQIEREVGTPLTRIVTGGNAVLLKTVLPTSFRYDPNLILKGLYTLYLRNRGKDHE